MMISNQSLYWLGEPCKCLSSNSESIIKKHFTIIELEKDTSIIQSSSISAIAFHFTSSNDIELLNKCLKLCENLKKILLVFYCGAASIFDNVFKSNFIKINTESSDLELETKEIKKMIFKENLNNKKIAIEEDLLSKENKVDSSRNIINIINFIDERISENIKEEDVANYCNYSTTYFSKYFHQEIGISFRDYVCSKRINRAKNLLIENYDIKITVIAYQCGYNDLSYFTRIFKKKTGMSPGCYRKEYLHKREI